MTGGTHIARRYWSDRLAARVKPEEINGNMGLRARVWRGLVDWGWGIQLETTIWQRCVWFARRLKP